MALTEKYVSSAAVGGGTGLSIGSPYTFSEMVTAINAGTEAGSRFNVLAGTYTRTATDTISGSGTSTSPVVIRGYSSVIGDGYLGRTNGNGALITTNMPVLSYNATFLLSATGSLIITESLRITGNRSGNVLTSPICKSCRVENASTNAAASGISSANTIDNDVLLTGASGGATGYGIQNSTGYAIGNRVSSGTTTAVGISLIGANRAAHAILNTVFGSGGTGIGIPGTSTTGIILLNTLVGCAGDGIDIVTGSTVLHTIIGNMITDNGGYGIDLNSAAVAAFLAYNRTRDNTSGAINSGTDWVAATSYGHVTTDTGGAATDYTNSGANDYSLIAASPATSAGIPAYASIGALQRAQNVTASPVGSLVNSPLIN